VKVGAIDITKLKADREQLWAEAVAAFCSGANWWLDRANEEEAREEQANRRIPDVWEQAVMTWATAQVASVTVQEALANAVCMDLDRATQQDSNRIALLGHFVGRRRPEPGAAARAAGQGAPEALKQHAPNGRQGRLWRRPGW
jgi:predicted P-loop ATPase